MKTTNFICVIDRSGSMSWGWEQTKESFAKLIEEQKSLEGIANITLAFFDNEYIKAYDNAPLNVVNIEKVFKDFKPRGMTALNDAICKTILDYDSKNYKADGTMVVIVTDGGENCSKTYTKQNVDDLKEAKEKAGWEFSMLGKSKEQIRDYGIKADNSVLYDKRSESTMSRGHGAMRRRLSSYRASVNTADTVE